jgi:hypothetical protein
LAYSSLVPPPEPVLERKEGRCRRTKGLRAARLLHRMPRFISRRDQTAAEAWVKVKSGLSTMART